MVEDNEDIVSIATTKQILGACKYEMKQTILRWKLGVREINEEQGGTLLYGYEVRITCFGGRFCLLMTAVPCRVGCPACPSHLQ